MSYAFRSLSYLKFFSTGLVCQLILERKKAPFPPAPFQQWRWARSYERYQVHKYDYQLATGFDSYLLSFFGENVLHYKLILNIVPMKVESINNSC